MLTRIELESEGFARLREYLIGYTSSERFSSLSATTQIVLEELSRVRYTVRIKGARVTVRASSSWRVRGAVRSSR